MEVIKCSICQAVVSDSDKPCWSCGGDSKNIKKTTSTKKNKDSGIKTAREKTTS